MSKNLKLIVLIATVLIGCSNNNFTAQEIGDQILHDIAVKNFNELASHTAPNGVRLSPYGFVKPDVDVVLKPSDFTNDDNTLRIWGEYDGSGEPIKMTLSQYWDRFVYQNDYLNTEAHEEPNSSNLQINHSEIYPNAEIVKYSYPGSDPNLAGMDWSKLNLVLEQINGEWMLIGIINEEWTI